MTTVPPAVIRWYLQDVLHVAMRWQVTPWDTSDFIEVVW